MTRFFAFACLFLSLSSAAAFAQPAPTGVFEDDGSQTGDHIHICQQGSNYYPMIGVDLHNNRFLCSPTSLGISTDGKENGNTLFTYNGSNHPVHTCVPGKAMVGLEVADNTILCSPATLTGTAAPDTGTQVVEPNHDRHTPMHGCPPGMYMVGIQAHDNVLICQKASTP